MSITAALMPVALTSAGRGAHAERRRRAVAVLVSLLIHGLLLSLTFGGQGLGLPGFGLPWQERRAEATELRVVLVPPKRGAEPPLPPAANEPPRVDAAPTAVAVISPEPTLKKDGEAASLPAVVAEPAVVPARPSAPADTEPPPRPRPDVIALARPDESKWVVPVTPTPSASSAQAEPPVRREAMDVERERALELAELDRVKREAQQKAEQLEAARQDALKQAAARQEAARLDAARQEADRLEAARQSAAQAEAARKDAERLEATRQAAARQQAAEAARQEAARQETAKAEAARQEAARAEAARLETERQEAARQAAARQESARQEAARQDAARQEAGRADAARLAEAQAAAERREAKLRAIGQQLNEEADRRDAAAAAAARQSPALPPSASSARRGRLFGRSDANAELLQYAETWSRKIQFNQTFEMVREAAKQPYTDPLVTVAIRSDGSVESVNFVRSSGVPALDEAIRRVVHSQANYPPFQPALAREFDVVEIRRTWHFDMAIRLY